MKIGNVEVYGIIYKITNKVNGKVYIGQTSKRYGFKQRYNQHGETPIEKVYNHYIYKKERGENYNQHLLRSIEKYGFDSFDVIEKFDMAFSRNELLLKEKCWISVYKSYNEEFGYNKTLGGEGTYGYSFWNEKSEDELSEIRKKMSESTKGELNPMYGKNPRDYMTEEAKYHRDKKMSLIMSGENNPMYGKNPRDYMSEEAKREQSRKLSEANKGEKHWNYGKHLPEETIEKIKETKKKNKEKYSGKNSKVAKSIICLTTRRIFHTVTDGAKYYGVKNRADISKCCKGKLKTCGKYKDCKLVWRYIIWKHDKKYRIKE